MEKKNVNIIVCIVSDYECIYVDGVLEYENHRIPHHVWLEVISKYQTFEDKYAHLIIEVDSEYIEDLAGFPKYFEDIPKDMIL